MHRRWQTVIWIGSLALCASLAVVRALPDLHFCSDDAWISFRYAWNLVHGHGLTWMVGMEPVEGYSNLTWTLWTALGLALDVAPFHWVKAWGLILTACTVLATAGCVRVTGAGRFAAVAAALLVAGSTVVVQWGTTGMETPLVALLLVAGTWRGLAEERAIREATASHASTAAVWPWSLLLFGLLAVSRPEGVLYLSVPVVLRLTRRPIQRVGWRDLWQLGLLALPFAAQLTFRLVYYDAWVSNTYQAKILSIDLHTTLLGLRYLICGAAYNPALSLLWVFGGWAALRSGRGWPLLPAAITAVFVMVAGGDTFAHLRFLAHVAPLLAAAALAGLDALVAGGLPRRRLIAVAAGVTFVVALYNDWMIHQILVEPPAPPALRAAEPGMVSPGITGPPPRESIVGMVRHQLGPPWVEVQRLGAGVYLHPLFASQDLQPEPLEWFLAVALETVPAGGCITIGDVGLTGFTLADLRVLDSRGLNWPAMARLRGIKIHQGPLRQYPEALEVSSEFVAQQPDLVFLQCADDRLYGYLEAVLMADGQLQEGYHFLARGPYFSGGDDICIYYWKTLPVVEAAVVQERYQRLAREAPGARDWARRLALLNAPGRDHRPWAPYADSRAPRLARPGRVDRRWIDSPVNRP